MEGGAASLPREAARELPARRLSDGREHASSGTQRGTDRQAHPHEPASSTGLRTVVATGAIGTREYGVRGVAASEDDIP